MISLKQIFGWWEDWHGVKLDSVSSIALHHDEEGPKVNNIPRWGHQVPVILYDHWLDVHERVESTSFEFH
jgi:hypothetical protein